MVFLIPPPPTPPPPPHISDYQHVFIATRLAIETSERMAQYHTQIPTGPNKILDYYVLYIFNPNFYNN